MKSPTSPAERLACLAQYESLSTTKRDLLWGFMAMLSEPTTSTQQLVESLIISSMFRPLDETAVQQILTEYLQPSVYYGPFDDPLKDGCVVKTHAC